MKLTIKPQTQAEFQLEIGDDAALEDLIESIS